MSISLSFSWNEQAFATAGEIAYKYKATHTYKKYYGYFFIALMVLGSFRAVGLGDYSMLYIGVILSLYWYVARGLLYKSRLKSQFKKEHIKNATMKFTFSKEGVNINGNMIPWSHISKVIVHPKGFLLERREGYPYIPATAFESDNDVEKLLDILEQEDILLLRMS
ncbi:MAG: hypothetical protein HF962_01440 [Sulfurovum sp.]|nr:hypothetical protein [Sulfurovum sp.]